MELEYKFALANADQGTRILCDLRSGKLGNAVLVLETRKDMDSTYFDTPSGALWKAQFALRLRRENDTQVCCLKYGGGTDTQGLSRRGELECTCESLDDGVKKLAVLGAPETLYELCAQGLTETASVCFVRQACLVNAGGTVCELAFDQGYFGSKLPQNRFYELELEFKSGSEAVFADLADQLVQKYLLRPETRTKLSRALLAAGT